MTYQLVTWYLSEGNAGPAISVTDTIVIGKPFEHNSQIDSATQVLLILLILDMYP